MGFCNVIVGILQSISASKYTRGAKVLSSILYWARWGIAGFQADEL